MSKSATKGLAESCPSFRRGHLPHFEDVERLRSLTKPHVESFNYFLEVGLAKGIKDIEHAELDLVDVQKVRDEGKADLTDASTVRFWVEDGLKFDLVVVIESVGSRTSQRKGCFWKVKGPTVSSLPIKLLARSM